MCLRWIKWLRRQNPWDFFWLLLLSQLTVSIYSLAKPLQRTQRKKNFIRRNEKIGMQVGIRPYLKVWPRKPRQGSSPTESPWAEVANRGHQHPQVGPQYPCCVPSLARAANGRRGLTVAELRVEQLLQLSISCDPCSRSQWPVTQESTSGLYTFYVPTQVWGDFLSGSGVCLTQNLEREVTGQGQPPSL